MAQHLYVRHLRYRNDFLEPVANVFQTRRYVFVEQYHEVALLRDVLPRLDPTRHVPVQCKRGRARYNRTLFLNKKNVVFFIYGFHPRSCGFKYRMPARDTVAGVAVRKLDISNISLMDGVRAIRSLLASVKTYET